MRRMDVYKYTLYLCMLCGVPRQQFVPTGLVGSRSFVILQAHRCPPVCGHIKHERIHL